MALIIQKWATLLICPMIISINAIPLPGLLKVPKVYNALITSDQNLEPSRAYPVIQPVVHRTSIGYVPNCVTCHASPFYFTQVGPGFVGPQFYPGRSVIPIPTGPLEGTDTESSQSSGKQNPDAEEIEMNSKNVEGRETLAEKERSSDDETKNSGTNKERVPLSFYPNYRSLYYNPYFYGYHPYSHVAPGTYYFDYQPRGPLVPLPLPFSSVQPHPDSVRSVTSVPSSSSSKLEKKKKIKVESAVM